jgi:hypothetical protein
MQRVAKQRSGCGTATIVYFLRSYGLRIGQLLNSVYTLNLYEDSFGGGVRVFLLLKIGHMVFEKTYN